MLILETWIAVLIMLIIFLFGGIGIIGWIIEGMRLDAEKKENRMLQFRIRQLERIIARKNGAENIRTANEYYEESKKND